MAITGEEACLHKTCILALLTGKTNDNQDGYNLVMKSHDAADCSRPVERGSDGRKVVSCVTIAEVIRYYSLSVIRFIWLRRR